jgi:hypothetical protein
MDPKILRFHINVAAATKQNEYWTFNPKPSMFINKDKFDFVEYEKYITTLSEMNNETLLSTFNQTEISSESTLLNWLVKSCPYDLYDMSFKVSNKKNEYTQIQVGDLPTKSNIKYLYHGSPEANWHSIIRNGLIVTSGTDMQTTGAVHGNGIYLSDSLRMSMEFTKCKEGQDVIIGVFMVEDAEQYKVRTVNHIYVVPDKDKVQIKYMICTKYTKQDMLAIGNVLTAKYEAQAKTRKVATDSFRKRWIQGNIHQVKLAIKRIGQESMYIKKLYPTASLTKEKDKITMITEQTGLSIKWEIQGQHYDSIEITATWPNGSFTVTGKELLKTEIGHIWNNITKEIE